MVGGTQIGAYRILHQIGEGGMGSVWMAEHAMLGRRAAIKVLHPEFSARADVVSRFFNEARAATAISDPGIVQIFDFGHHVDGSAYIVMELLDGETLDRRLRRLGRIPPSDTLRIMRQVASSLAAAHARGIVHRDLKPENIFVVRDPEVAGGERPKILDFGIAKLTGDERTKTQTSAILGTPTFMSPEQCRGAGLVDQRSDVYSLGCVLFMLLVGHPPFVAEGVGDLIAMHLREPAPLPSSLAAGISTELDRLVLTCLAKDPAQRFASAAELAIALGALLGSSPQVVASRATPTPHSSQPFPVSSAQPTTLSSATGTTGPTVGARRSRGLVLAVAGVAVVAGAIAFGVTRGSSSEERPAPDPPPHAASPPVPVQPAAAAQVVPDPKAELAARMKHVLERFSAWSRDHVGAPCPDLGTLGISPSDLTVTCNDQPGDQMIGVVAADGTASWQLGHELTDLVRGPRWSASAPLAPTVTSTAPRVTTKKPTASTPKTTPSRKPSSGVQLDENGIPISR